MEPQDPKDVTRNIARDLTGMAGELAALKADARHWLTDPGYAVLHLRLERERPRGGRGRARGGQAQGEDERGGVAVRRGRDPQTFISIRPKIIPTSRPGPSPVQGQRTGLKRTSPKRLSPKLNFRSPAFSEARNVRIDG